jgi:hypothetical protein
VSKVVGTLWGLFCVIFGIVAIGWISYLLFVDNVERVEPKGFVFGYAMAVGAVAIGIRRVRGQPATGPLPDRGDPSDSDEARVSSRMPRNQRRDATNRDQVEREG